MNKKAILWGLIRLVISAAILVGLIYLFFKYYDIQAVFECLFNTCRR